MWELQDGTVSTAGVSTLGQRKRFDRAAAVTESGFGLCSDAILVTMTGATAHHGGGAVAYGDGVPPAVETESVRER